MATLSHMGRKKKEAESSKQSPRPRKLVGIRDIFLGPCEEVVRKKGFGDITEFVNQAVREALEREGLWPPKPDEE